MPLGALGRVLGYDLALDPGSGSVRALARTGEIVAVPSVLARVDPSGGGFLRTELVGEPARALGPRAATSERGSSRLASALRPERGPGPDVRIVKPIARGAVTDVAAAERLFAHVFQEAPRRTWGARPRAVAGVGAGLTPVEQRALAAALKGGGAKGVTLVPALAACAIALERYASQGPAGAGSEGAARLIVELGAERTGFGIASRSGVIASGFLGLGARDLDLALAGRLRRRGLAISTEDAGRLRMELGLPAPGAGLREDEEEAGPLGDAEDVLPRDVGAALGPFLRLIADEVRELLVRSPDGVAEDVLEFGVALAGAPASTPGFADALSADLELPVTVARDPADLRVRGLALLMDEPDLLAHMAVDA
ncbi:MAG: rod shape-determining protein [Planctomycetota bacterium]